jgi:phosphate starvation-inducible PhoH-like protein
MEEIIKLKNPEDLRLLLGNRDRNLRLIRNTFGVKAVARDGRLHLIGEKEDITRAKGVVERLLATIAEEGKLSDSDVELAIRAVKERKGLVEGEERIEIGGKNIYVRARTAGQAEYIKSMRRSDLVFSIGPAGTGKTYLAVAMAINALRSGQMKKIILARPAVEAGEIEVIPLAYMRGRTLNDAFIILDEAQNTTALQMKMFLTRMGMRCHIVVTGDVSQIDLPVGEVSGLKEAERLFKNISGVEFIYLTRKDIVRHRLVAEIVKAYERDGRARGL